MNRDVDGVEGHTVARFREQLSLADPRDAKLPDSLRESLYAIVDEMKAAGKKPEAVIITIRLLCLDSGWASTRYTSGNAEGGVHGMVDKLISLCIERYFSSGDSGKQRPAT